MVAILVVAAPRKARRHRTWTTAPESRYMAGWAGAIGWLQPLAGTCRVQDGARQTGAKPLA